jgi:hypothetical protein
MAIKRTGDHVFSTFTLCKRVKKKPRETRDRMVKNGQIQHDI